MERYTQIKHYLQRHWVMTNAVLGSIGGITCILLAGPINGIILAVVVAILNLIGAISTPDS